MSGRPSWLTVHAPSAEEREGMRLVRSVLSRYHLATVCQGALCPNAAECWGRRTATFMLLGEACTRACRFCAVPTGNPGGKVDAEEPERLARAVAELELAYVVLTSVDRDDLKDGGASFFAEAIRRVKATDSLVKVEALVPDFGGNEEALRTVAASGADVLGHNLETVRRLTPSLRDRRASYALSLKVLSRFRALAPGNSVVKSALLLGLGETREEILEALSDLRAAGVDAVALGQYLRPTRAAAPVVRYVTPAEFAEFAEAARGIGFRSVLAGPLVRSSYHAAELFAR